MRRLTTTKALSSLILYIYITLFVAGLLQTVPVFAQEPKPVTNYHLYVARFSNGDVVIIDSATHKEIGRMDFGIDSNPTQIVPSLDYKFLYVILRGIDEIAVIDVKSRKVISKIKAGIHPDNTAITPNGRYLIVTNNQGKDTSIIDLSTNTIVGSPHISDNNSGSSGVAVTGDSKYAYVTSTYYPEIWVIDLDKKETVSTLEIDGSAAIVIPPDSAMAYFCSPYNKVSVLDTRTNKVIDSIQVGDQPINITLSKDGGLAFIANYWSDSVSVIDLAKRKVIRDIKVGEEPSNFDISPDGRFLFVTNYRGWEDRKGSISVVDIKNLEEIEQIKLYRYPRAIAVLPAK